MISLSATRAFKAYHFEVPHNLSKNEIKKPPLKIYSIGGEGLLFWRQKSS